MKKISILIIIVIYFLVGTEIKIANAQDTIIKRNGDIIKAKISEIGTEEVKFKLYNNSDGPTVIMKKSEIKTLKSGGQTLIDDKIEPESAIEDIIVKKNGDVIKAKVTDIGTDEIKFKLNNDTDGPTISIKKSEIKTLKVGGQIVIEDKTGSNEAIITKKDGSIIKAKISEMGTDEIKFKLYNNPDGPTMSLKKFDIKSIKIDGQTVYEYKEDPLSATNHSIIDKTSTFKFYFLSPINRHIAFGYEWMYKPGFNWDVALGVIGPGIISTTTKTAKGLFFRAGPKFLLGNSSDIETGDGDIKIRYAHPLKGKYIKVEAILNAFSTTHTIDTGGYSYYNGFSYYTSKGGQITYKNRYQALTLNLQFGKQYIFGNAMTFAWYFGFGYSFENKTSDLSSQNKIYDVFDFNRYSHTYFGKSLPMVFTWGITIGYILRAPDWLTKGSAGYDAKPSRHYKEGVQIK